jgi:DNA-binding MarR family transcriptional regulator
VSAKDPVRWLNDDEMGFWLAFLYGNRRLIDALDRDMREHFNIGLDDYEVLANLSEAPEHRMRMSDLAQKVIMPKNKLTYRIDRLVEAGNVRREPCTLDRRVHYAVLTNEGMKLVRRAAPTHLRSVRHHFLDQLADVNLTKLTAVFDSAGTTELS